jgi:hypothetical protein
VADAPPLADVNDLAVLVQLPSTDPRLPLAIRRASDRFRGAVHHPVHLVTDDVTYVSGDGSRTLLLPAAPVVGSVAIVVTDLDGTTTLDPSLYQIGRRNGIITRTDNHGWPVGLENIEVTYTHGYDPVPGEISDAVLDQAAAIAMTLAHVQQESGGSQSASYRTGVNQNWTDMVTKYSLGDR